MWTIAHPRFHASRHFLLATGLIGGYFMVTKDGEGRLALRCGNQHEVHCRGTQQGKPHNLLVAERYEGALLLRG